MNERPSIGIDAGGSRLRLAGSAASAGVDFESAGVNLWRDGIESTSRRIASAVDRALLELGSPGAASVVAGVAGALEQARARDLEHQIRDDLLGSVRSIRVISDVQLAHYAAHDDTAGLTVVIGTGSVILARATSGEERVVGGWGYLMGDEGSGFALGLAVLRHLAQCLDKGMTTNLTTVLRPESAAASRSTLLKNAYGEEARIQDFAPALIRMAESGDEEAVNLIDEQTGLLADQICVAQKALDGVPPRVAFVGGLSTNGYYADKLFGKLSERNKGFTRIHPVRSALDQALLMAQRDAEASA